MTRFTKIAIAVAAFTVSLTLVPTAEACGGRRGGGYSGSPARRPNYNFGGHNRTSYHSAPRYHAPVYQQPIVHQPVITQPVVTQPVITQPVITQPAPQPIVQQPIAPQQPIVQQPAPQPNTVNAALQALGGFAPPAGTQQPQAPVVQQPAAPQHVGTFKAQLGNGSIVELTLGQNGQFSWTATNPTGSTSSFNGSYTVGNGSLTIVRTDGQRLAGNLSDMTAGGFKFQLGNNAAALNFVRG